MQDERKSVCVPFREVQHIFPPVMRNEPDLRKMLVSSAHFKTPDGDDIELFVLSATQEVAFLITSANLDSVNAREQAEVILRKAFAHGVFDELLLVMKVLRWLKPFILRTADHAAQREAKHLELRLQSGEVQCGGECTCK
jgi:hypothetical protein